jgi:hypothetical protein
MRLLSVGVVIEPSGWLFHAKCLYSVKLLLREGTILILTSVLARARRKDS